MRDRERQHRGWLVALAYFDLLGKPLTVRELRRYLWGVDLDVSVLKKIAKPWELAGGVYGLKPVSSEVREENARRLARYWRWIDGHRRALAWVPFVRLIMVMNGVAQGEVNDESDIDLFVVARKGRVWLCRAWMLALLTILGLRARAGKKAMRFSPEFFVDEEHMNMLGVGSDSSYLTSFWISDFTPILHSGYFAKFWSANSWLSGNLPVAWRSPRARAVGEIARPALIGLFEWILGGVFGDTMERILADKQQGIIQRNLQRMGDRPDYLINEHTIKIHFQSNRPRVVEDVVAGFLAERH